LRSARIALPPNEDAVAVVRRQIGKHAVRVFTGPDGRPLDEWQKAPRSG